MAIWHLSVLHCASAPCLISSASKWVTMTKLSLKPVSHSEFFGKRIEMFRVGFIAFLSVKFPNIWWSVKHIVPFKLPINEVNLLAQFIVKVKKQNFWKMNQGRTYNYLDHKNHLQWFTMNYARFIIRLNSMDKKKIINVKRTEINTTGNRNFLKCLSLTPLVLDWVIIHS